MDGHLMSYLSHRTAPLSLSCSGNHRETTELFVIPLPNHQVVLGLYWLKHHNPVIGWPITSITSWSCFFHQNCLKSTTPTAFQFQNHFLKTPTSQLSLVPIMTLSRFSLKIESCPCPYTDPMIGQLTCSLAPR